MVLLVSIPCIFLVHPILDGPLLFPAWSVGEDTKSDRRKVKQTDQSICEKARTNVAL
jgi:hypothetical protein